MFLGTVGFWRIRTRQGPHMAWFYVSWGYLHTLEQASHSLEHPKRPNLLFESSDFLQCQWGWLSSRNPPLNIEPDENHPPYRSHLHEHSLGPSDRALPEITLHELILQQAPGTNGQKRLCLSELCRFAILYLFMRLFFCLTCKEKSLKIVMLVPSFFWRNSLMFSAS